MGGNDIEVSLVQLTNGLYRYVDTVKLENVGGDIFTEIVVDILCEEFQRSVIVVSLSASNPNRSTMFFLSLQGSTRAIQRATSAQCSS